jgi:hypothetical protein
MKNTTLSLLLVLFVSACSHKTETTVTSNTGTLQYSILATDVDSTSVKTLTNGTSAPKTRVIVVFSDAKAAEFKKFTQDHMNQTVQILVGTNIAATAGIGGVMPGNKIDFDFSTSDEAKKITDYLAKKP